MTAPIRASPPRRIEGIEAARGVAAVVVVLYHVSRHIDATLGLPMLRRLFQFGHAGVDLFFVISGFIIFYIHEDDIGRPERLMRYATRRASRILPIYWVAFAVTATMAALGHHAMPGPLDLVWQASLLPSSGEMLLGIAWTLRFEVLFYLLFAVLIAHRRIGAALMGAWLVLAIGLVAYGAQVPVLPGQFQSAYDIEFLFGMTAAWAARHHAGLVPARAVATGTLLFLTAALLEDAGWLDGYASIARLAYGLPSALIVAGIVTADARGGVVVPAPLAVLGSASYSIYIFQFVWIGTIWQALLHAGDTHAVPPWLLFVLLTAAAILAGIAASRLIEKPLMRACRSLLGGRPAGRVLARPK